MRIPVASQLMSRDGSLTKDARLTNCFIEQKQDRSAIVSRPGLSKKFALGSGNGNGMVEWRGTLYVVKGNTLTQGPTAAPVTDGSVWSNTLTTTEPTYHAVKTQSGYAYNAASDTVYMATNQTGSDKPHIYKSVAKADVSYVGEATSLGSRGSAAYVWHGSKLFVLGGYYSSGASWFNSVWSSADGATWAQETASAPWSGRYNSCVLSHGGYIWLYGGVVSGYSNSTEMWRSSDGVNWTRTSTTPGASVVGHTLVSHGGRIYLIGNVSGTNVVYSTADGVSWTNDCANIGVDTSYAACASHAGKLWIIGAGAGRREVWKSSSGATWSQATATASFPDGQYRGAISDGTDLYVVPNSDARSWWKATNNVPGGESYTVADFPTNFTSTSAAATTDYLFVKNGTDAWVLTFGFPGTLTLVSDADYPASTVPGCAHLDGYIFVMDEDGVIYNSDLEAPLSWNSLNYITAEGEPDYGVALVKHNNYIVALKSTTIEAFFDAANPAGSPLSLVNNSPYRIGCANGWSVSQIDGKTFFMSQTNSHGTSVHYLPPDSLSPVEIATEDVKRVLAASTLSTVRAFSMRMSGHTFYVLNLLSDGVSLVFDVGTGMWATWTYREASSPVTLTSLTQVDGVATATKTGHGFSDGDLVTHAGATPSGYNVTANITVIDANTYTFPVSSALASPATGTITATGTAETHFPFSAFCSAGGVDYVQHEDSGDIYEISPDYTKDDTQYIDVHARMPKLDMGKSEKKTVSSLEVIGDKVDADLLVRWSDDDYTSYSKYRKVDLGSNRSRISRLGSFNRRAFELRFTDDAKVRISEIEI